MKKEKRRRLEEKLFYSLAGARVASTNSGHGKYQIP